ncbi:MAG: DUF342 domain-containing protein [Desulfobacteraceae bacterium]|nr:DUF342 domain-containing protein [Desulfobacteraceae bacterium]
MSEKNNQFQLDKDNRDIISLAVKCKFINMDQEDKVLAHLFKQLQSQPGRSVVQIFKELKILSDEELNLLLSIKQHLEIKTLDKRFGKLAIANNFTTVDAIEKGLKSQSAIYKKTRRNLPLGDILVKSRQLSEPHRTALMLTQDRIKDEYLAKAMNDLAKSELERLEISKRFGTIAAKLGLVSIEDVNKALAIQKNEVKHGMPKRSMEDILKESFGLPPGAALGIFKKQKIVEKQRLNLESALSQYNSEIKINRKLSRLFEYSISKDKLEVFVRINKSYSDTITVYNLQNWLKLAGIQFGLVDDLHIQEFLNNGQKGAEIKVAQGIPPKGGQDATIKFCFDIPSTTSPKKQEKGANPFVRKGDPLAKRVPHKEGETGMDIFGRIIYPKELKTWDIGCGKGVEIIQDNTFVSTIDGYPMLYQDRTLFVTPKEKKRKTLLFSGNVEPGMGDSYQKINLEVAGNISPGASLKCHQLSISGDVLGMVKATGDVDIKGGIGIKNMDPSNSLQKSLVTADGNINVRKNVEHTQVDCGKLFQALNADVVSSQISAFEGIFVKNVYCNGGDPCTLRIGHQVTQKILDLDQEIDQMTKELRELLQSDKMEAMDERLHHQIQVQDEFREKQNALTYLIKIMGDLDLDNVGKLGPGFDFLSLPDQEEGDGEVTYGIPKKTKAYEYLQEVLDEIDGLSPKKQLAKVQKMLELNSGMYKTAVNATERMDKESQIKTDLAQKQGQANISKVQKIEEKLATSKMEKDYLFSEHEMALLNKVPEVRVKNQISQGVVIEGNQSRLVIEKTIYGVKFFETKNPVNNKFGIVIKGYYE